MNNFDLETSKKVFLRLAREEQLGALFMWIQAIRNDYAKLVLEREDLKKEITIIRGELIGIGHRRNGNGHPTLTTSQKFDLEFSKRNRLILWYIDKVLPGTLVAIQTTIVLAVLYLAFGGKAP